jgi:hypothetical protein
MKNIRNPALGIAMIAAALGSGTAYAQQTFETTQCRSGTATVLAHDDKKVVVLLDHRGVALGSDASNPFHGSTHRCIGVLANFDGKVTANGWCKQVNPQTGDWAVLDWVNGDQPGAGTWTFRHGTGKWKGISGGGTYVPLLGQTRPVEPGTYQNCVRVKGTFSIPG